MCGIAAIFAYAASAPPVDASELRAIRDAMAPRGPDDAGAWLASDGRAGLAHRRLAIIDLSPAGHQPMALPGDTAVVTYNGEIYNYAALRAELVAQGRRLVSHSDTEVLLHLYDRDGADCVKHLRGMFAFAIWDARKRGLFLARDPLGIKPLYCADDGATFRVASQVKALMAGGHAGRGLEPAGHVGFFLWGHVPDPWTLYRDIRALPAGHTQWVDAAGARAPAPFFKVEHALDVPASATCMPLAAAMAESVRHHFVADTPVGVFLSAGIDSGVLASFAARERGADLRTITLGFDAYEGTAADEVPLARRVAEAFGAAHHVHRVGVDAFAHARVRLFEAMDQPTTDGINTYFVAEAARAHGLKVALSGLGGDELFGGYPSFTQVPKAAARIGPWARCAALGRAFRAVSAPLLKHMTSPKYAGLLEYGGTYEGAYLLRRSLFMPWELPSVLDGEVVREGWRALEPLARAASVHTRLPAARQKVSALEMSFYMRDRLLRDADWAGMAHGVEIRVPFVDATLLSQLAPALASCAPPGKADLAASAPIALPAEIARRAKTGFVVPVREWLMGSGADFAGERGLRGWARHVHRAFAT
jgi:asparagine synthase (glutamine-hydrolysing)